MLTELTGLTLARTLPESTLLGVMSGAYKVYGGVIRDNSGKIVAHLVNSTNSLSAMTPLLPINTVIGGLNTYQLSRIGADVTQLLSLAKGTIALSGLTLGVSAVGFIFLNQKLKKIDNELKEISRDVKYIREFLDLQERARLITALKTLNGIGAGVDSSIKEKLLVNSKQVLSEIHEKYRSSLINVETVQEAIPIEEYFIVTALGHALCAAELEMHDHAYKELKEAYDVWHNQALNFANKFINGQCLTGFMEPRYANHLKTEELIDWIDFANKSNRGLKWIDDIRERGPVGMTFHSRKKEVNKYEKYEIGFMRKICEREKVLNGYVDQHEHLAKRKMKPSEFQRQINDLPEEQSFNDCFILMNKKFQRSS